ncbi:FGGY-family carbohydrate kinase [Candidatus Symbiopectobacterium endolongispinus]|uniref:FGGY-family carbohydrate kinase n=1 Tax=Candidatus Symbiopectobacterium endolongispinus TaxID=2812664 RepID=UPI003F68480F
MSVMLSAASCLDWVARLTHAESVSQLLEEMAQATVSTSVPPVWFLPYLSGERTPHNNTQAKGAFWVLTHQHGRAELARAVLEGVGLALADGMDVLHMTGLRPSSITLIGGGARSAYWRQMLADISGQTLEYRTGGDVGTALGAARLAQSAVNPAISLADLLPPLPLEQIHQPDTAQLARYAQQRETFRMLYQQLRP